MFDQEQVSLLLSSSKPGDSDPQKQRDSAEGGGKEGDEAGGSGSKCRGPFVSVHSHQLITSSIDKSIRFWHVDSGDMLKVFTDSSPALSAAFLPFNPTAFVASNSNSILRLVCSTTGRVIQKLKVESEVRALKFDDTGLFCFAGTKAGAVHVLEASDTINIRFKFKTSLGR
ncbi:myosin f, partial [Cystoisospora suis]